MQPGARPWTWSPPPVVARVRELFAFRVEPLRKDTLMHGLLRAGLATLGFLVAALVLWRTHRMFGRRLSTKLFDRVPPMFGLDLRPALLAVSRLQLRLSFIVAGFISSYLWLTFVFVSFSYTRPWPATLGQWLLIFSGLMLHSIVAALAGLSPSATTRRGAKSRPCWSSRRAAPPASAAPQNSSSC